MATEKTYKVKFGIENNYVVEDVTKSQVVKVIALQGANFEPTIVSDLPATGDSSKLYLAPKNYTTGTATGNPITITLGEEAGQITDAKLDGDTYQQSYTGKNCYIVANTSSRDIVETVNDDGTFNLVGTASANAYLINYSPLALMENGATYTWWTNLDNLPSGLEFRLAAAKDNSWVRNMVSPMSSTNVSRTLTANTTGDVDQIRCEIWVKSGTTLDLHNIQIQLEKSATKTDFEPYCGGVPSPNPDYPQQIQTVTGEQTVSINGTDYPIDLGSIELCKLGDYQDYIYKDGSDWKVHKATKSVTLTGSENWQYRTAGTTADFYQINNSNWNDYFGAGTNAIGTGSTDVQPISAFAADKLTSIDANDTNMKANEGIGKKGQWFRISLLTSRGVTSVEGFKTWLASNNVKTYYALATATDTTITDQTLIAQLEAVRNATLQASNTITNTATGTNLAGDLELAYEEYNPTNRYDKWIWLQTGYEQL